jgi:N-acetylglucosaminyl-diphospho-decaprenol L-rhamnosyltransferase
VVTVTYRSSTDIVDFLRSFDGTVEVSQTVVVDNLSEQSAEIERVARSEGAQVIRLDDNVGYGLAVNAGVAALSPDIQFVMISNPDVRLEPGTISTLVEQLRAHPRTAAIGPKILNEDGSIYPSARRVPSLREGVGHALFARIWPGNPWSRRYREDAAPSDEPRDVGWLSGACLMVRRSAFDEIHGFDGDYFMYFEDVDLGYRFGRAGWTNRYEPSASVTHVGGTSTSSDAARMLRVHHRSAERFLSLKYRGWYLAPLRWCLHLGLMARARWVTRGLANSQSFRLAQPNKDDR